MVITKHAKKRMKQRCGVNKKSMDRIAEIAYENGLKHGELTGNLKKYVDGLYLKHKAGNQIRLYGDKVYIFHDKRLITVFQIPNNLMKEVTKLRKERDKKVKDYK